MVWTNSGSLFFIASNVNVIKDLVTHRDGRGNSLAAIDAYAKTQAKTGSARSQILWFLDITKVIKIVTKANAKAARPRPSRSSSWSMSWGSNGLKSVGGALSLERRQLQQPDQDLLPGSQARAGAAQDLLAAAGQPSARGLGSRHRRQLPVAELGPRQRLSTPSTTWSTSSSPACSTCSNSSLPVPTAGQPLSFQNDIFGPLGDRITLISDFKKPIKEDSQRMLVGVALEDTKAFQSTLSRLIELAGAAPRSASSREPRSMTSSSQPPQPAPAATSGHQRPDQPGDRQGHAVPDHRHDAARANSPAGQA